MDEYEERWAPVKNALQEVLKKNYFDTDFEEVCGNVETMFHNNHGERLYNDLKNVVTQHLESQVSQS
jgi:cullin 3